MIWAPLIAGIGYLFGHALEWLFADLKQYETIGLLGLLLLFVRRERRRALRPRQARQGQRPPWRARRRTEPASPIRRRLAAPCGGSSIAPVRIHSRFSSVPDAPRGVRLDAPSDRRRHWVRRRNLCSFPVSVRGSASRNSTARGYLYGATVAFTKSCSAFTIASSPRVRRAQHDERLDDLPALLVGRADHRALGDGLVAQQHVFHLERGDVVAGRDDHVVGARLVEEVAVGVLQVGVAGVVPAALHVVGLARVAQVAAAGGALHREARRSCRRERRCRRRRRRARGSRARPCRWRRAARAPRRRR